ncbi:hypothetical protein [Janthinobacterium sp. PAMC25594]|uniref:hypothetical protein n=1 Tax=Janthinobacterium sp. PAMC25594 TaxID=2861284 RepID=UPI001C62D5DC|nr:hypothetical protein [Janthinobacterium sp. PAMC25594]QYG08931.1 hypothetical protein KY494_09385 [Janthinobacterium sp. PAMC25594]
MEILTDNDRQGTKRHRVDFPHHGSISHIADAQHEEARTLHSSGQLARIEFECLRNQEGVQSAAANQDPGQFKKKYVTVLVAHRE